MPSDNVASFVAVNELQIAIAKNSPLFYNKDDLTSQMLIQ
jgi:hypothetical protein